METSHTSASSSTSSVGTKSYAELVNWIRTSSAVRDIPAVQVLLNNVGVTAVGDEAFMKMAKSKYYEQAFRILGCMRTGFPHDRRVWEYAESLPDELCKPSLLVTTFFMTVKPGGSSRRNKTGFNTVLPTAFERLLYLMACTIVHFYVKEKTSAQPTRKRRKTSRLPSFKVSRDAGQRIGYAMQCINRGWDIFARSVGFESVESMIAPYIIYDKEEYVFNLIEEKAKGFAPLRQQSSLKGAFHPTLDEQICDTNALHREAHVDTSIRHLAGMFMKDVRTIVLSDRLYSVKPDEIFEDLKLFEPAETQGSLPKRFESLEASIIEALETALPDAQILSQDPEYPSIGVVVPRPASTSTFKTSSTGRNSASDTASVATAPSSVPEQDPPLQIETIQCSGGEDCECYSARGRLESHMSIYARLHECSFEDLAEVDMSMFMNGGGEGEAQLVLTDPPFNHRRENGHPNSRHDTLTASQMSMVTKVCDYFLAAGGHGVVFCSPLQFRSWYKLFRSSPGDGVFNVDPSPLTMVNSPGHYFGNIRKKTTALFPVTSWAVHVTKTGLRQTEAFELVDYNNHGYVKSRYPAWTNTIDGVMRLAPGEQLRGRDPDDSSSSVVFRPEQKNRALLMELVSRFSTPGALIVDLFSGTFSTASACLSLPKHRKFLGCENDPGVFKAAKTRLLENFASALLDEYSDITTSSEQTLADARLVRSHSVYNLKRDPAWSTPFGFPGYQTIPKAITRYLASLWCLPQFAAEYDAVPLLEWPQSMKGALESTPLEPLAAAEAARSGVCVAKSTIRHPEAGNGLFTMRSFARNETIGQYYGAIVYSDLSNRSQRTKYYGQEGLLGVRVSEFVTYAMKVPLARTSITVGTTSVTSAFIVPNELCVFRMMNDAGYRDEDEERLAVECSDIPARTPNVTFVCRTARNVQDLRAHTLISIVAKRYIPAGEELLASYREGGSSM